MDSHLVERLGVTAHGAHRVPGLAALFTAASRATDNDSWTAQYEREGIDLTAFEQWEQMFDPLLGIDLDPVLRSPQVEPVLVAAWSVG